MRATYTSTYDNVDRPPQRAAWHPRRREHNDVKLLVVRWARSWLVSPLRVVDIACGRGGDAGKFGQREGNVEWYCGVDVSAHAACEARRRCAEERVQRAQIAVGDAIDAFPQVHGANLVTCFFALHYLATSEARAAALLERVAGALQTGGIFAGCAVSEQALPTNVPRAWGSRYTYELPELIERTEECCVPWAPFVALAAEHDLHIAFHRSFDKFLRGASMRSSVIENRCYYAFAFIKIE